MRRQPAVVACAPTTSFLGNINLPTWRQRYQRWCRCCSGNEELKRKYRLTIVGPKADRDRIPGIDVALGEGDTWDFGQLQMQGDTLSTAARNFRRLAGGGVWHTGNDIYRSGSGNSIRCSL